MPKFRTLLCGPAPSRVPPEQAIAMLQSSDVQDAKLCVLTNAKFDAGKAAKTFNIEANYAPEPLQLHSMSAASGRRPAEDDVLTDGLEIFALRAVLERDGPFDRIVLQRNPINSGNDWPALFERTQAHGFVTLGDDNFVIASSNKAGGSLIEPLWVLYASGALYGLENYGFERALSIAAKAVSLNG